MRLLTANRRFRYTLDPQEKPIDLGRKEQFVVGTFKYSATSNYRAFGIGTEDPDAPPTDNEEDLIDKFSAATRMTAGENAIRNHVMVAFALGLVPVPVFDFAMLTTNQVKMVHTLGGIYGVPSFHGNRLKAVILSLVSGALPVLGVQGLSSGIKVMPGIGSLVGSGSVAVSGGLLTYAVGRVFLEHFESGGTYLNLDTKKARERLKQELKSGRRTVSDLWKKAKGAQHDAA